jgi:hypothetical protein
MALKPGSPMVLSMVDYTVMVIPMIIIHAANDLTS